MRDEFEDIILDATGSVVKDVTSFVRTIKYIGYGILSLVVLAIAGIIGYFFW